MSCNLDIDDARSFTSFRYLLVNFDCENLEKYELGGFHPVHLGDHYDDGRYKVVHKLGSGGFSTVWLAWDKEERRWVALKFVVADESNSFQAKNLSSFLPQNGSGEMFVKKDRRFIFHGPNGPSLYQAANGFVSRIKPQLSCNAGLQTTKALADLHAQGICHGDVTAANIVFTLSDIDRYTEDDIYRIFGQPTTESLITESGQKPGPEAPRYIVKAIDFLSIQENIIHQDARLIDFDQSFPITAPPTKMLGTPVEYLAPELAVGQAPSPASDVWALGCTIFRLRSGEGPFAGYEVTSPADLMRAVIEVLGDTPGSWGTLLFDYDGQPTQNPAHGQLLEKLDSKRSLKSMIYNIWDQPEHNIIKTDNFRPQQKVMDKNSSRPYPSCFSNLFWKPSAVRIDNTYLSGYHDETGKLLEAMPKIPEHEAALLFDLLSKIFIYDPVNRITAAEMLKHPWFKSETKA